MSKHTVQDWNRDGLTVYALNAEGSNRFSVHVVGGWATSGRNRTEQDELEANARLIAAAPDGLEVAESAYLALLGHPFDGWRMANQRVLCGLRDFIAKATGREEQAVQEEFEERAAIAKATGSA